jgi:nitroreductase
MDVSEAIATRRSVRAFRPDPIPVETIVAMLALCGRAPSGSNLQPWRVYVLAEAARDELIRRIKVRAVEQPKGEVPEHKIHPDDMQEPYKSRYLRASTLLYSAANIQREDMAARHAHLTRNWQFFGAPIGLIFTVRREMQPGQWADVGMFMQNLMLLARSRGLDTCAQEAWALWPSVLHDYLEIPPEELVYCGMAIGLADQAASINQFESERAAVGEYVTIKHIA